MINLLKETNRYHSSQLYDGDSHLLLKMLSWPAQRVFPVLDLARFLWLHPQASEFLLRAQLVNVPQTNILGIILNLIKAPTADPFVKITGLRNFVNLFVLPANREQHAMRLAEPVRQQLLSPTNSATVATRRAPRHAQGRQQARPLRCNHSAPQVRRMIPVSI